MKRESGKGGQRSVVSCTCTLTFTYTSERRRTQADVSPYQRSETPVGALSLGNVPGGHVPPRHFASSCHLKLPERGVTAAIGLTLKLISA